MESTRYLEMAMIVYNRLWEYMEKNNISQYRLVKSGISNDTLTRLRHNQSVSMDSINKLCTILDCRVEDIVEYVKELK